MLSYRLSIGAIVLSTLMQLRLSGALSPRTYLDSITVITVPTEDGLTWCRPYPDEMGDVVMYYYEPTPINVTRWAYTSMWDDKGIVQGDPVWLMEESGCWINEVYRSPG